MATNKFWRASIWLPANLALLLAPAIARPQAAASKAPAGAARAYEAARSNPLELEAFLRRMPKGTDLHYHFPGGIYAETWIRNGAEDGLCVDLATHSLVKPHPTCGAAEVPAAQAFSDQKLYDEPRRRLAGRSGVARSRPKRAVPGADGHAGFWSRGEDCVRGRLEG